jgi:hypothetical protein
MTVSPMHHFDFGFRSHLLVVTHKYSTFRGLSWPVIWIFFFELSFTRIMRADLYSVQFSSS